MGEFPKQIGSVTRVTKHIYYETPCGNTEPHPQHPMGGGANGGVSVGRGPFLADTTIESGQSFENWCMGIRGTMQV